MCAYASIDNSKSVIITKIKNSNDKFCYYYGDENSNLVFTYTEYEFMFKDTIDKFQIGDTINFVKNKYIFIKNQK